MQRAHSAPPNAGASRGRAMLALGILAGPLYLILGLVQIATREGFDIRRHALSHLSNGEFGWVQIANFLVSGALVIAGAIGTRRALRGQPGRTWGPILLGVYGIGLLGAGVFPADPGHGFPPGTEAAASISRNGMLHFAFGGIGFYAVIASCFVFARRFVRRGEPGLAWYSALTGLGFFVSFAAIASGSTAAAVMIAFYIAVAWIWVWHTIVLIQLLPRPS